MNECTVPATPEDVVGDGRWMSMHNRYVSETKISEPDVVFVGDSIIQGLQFSSIWNEKISSLHCLNFGIGGDRVQNVLWRLKNGEMDFNVKVKAVVLFVGTNNIEDKPQDIFEGIVECLKVIKQKLDDVYIIIPTLLPRGQFPNKLRVKNNQVNDLLSEKIKNCTEEDAGKFANVLIVPVHNNLLQLDDSLSHYIMYDYLHLTDAGYNKTFTAVYDKLCEIVQNR